jgi:diguanylate cyclase (GGDEF)-like protein/PAS domain S-box-containing protein
MFNLVRYFSFASLACIIGAAALLGGYYRYLSVAELLLLAEDRNVAIARVFGNALQHRFQPLLDSTHPIAGERKGYLDVLQQDVAAMMEGSLVVKVKVYDLAGLTVFSSDARQIGESKANNPGFVSAVGGGVVSELTHRDHFDAFEGAIVDRDLFSSYIPFHQESGPVFGVFELYYDVTPFLDEVRKTQWQVILGVVGVLSLLYGMLFGIVLRAQRVIDGQRRMVDEYVAKVEEANRLLDSRVQARTAELTESNARLQVEANERAAAEGDVRALLAEKVALLDNALIGVVFLRERRVVSCNRCFEAMFGYGDGDMLGLLTDILYPDRDAFEAIGAEGYEALSREGAFSCEAQLRRLDGTLFWAQINGRVLDQANPQQGSVWIFSDISARKESESRLRLAAKVFESTADAVVITDQFVNVLAVNRAFTEVSGFSEAEVVGRRPAILHTGRQDRAFYVALRKEIKARGYWQGELWDQRKDGEFFPMWMTIGVVLDERGRVSNYVGVFSDMTKIKEAQAKLQFLAHNDPLTHLPNRLLFNDRLKQAIERARRQQTRLSVMYIDLDHFKQINDSLGHPMGDRLLCCFVERVSGLLRASDTLARLGGDEFVLLLEELPDAATAAQVSSKIGACLVEPFVIDEHEFFVSASIGISLYPEDAADPNLLIQYADAAMYRAKASGRGRYHFYTSEMTALALERLELGSALRHAIENGELHVFYQPQIDLETGDLVGCEALVRWLHPQWGMISPVRFIPVAEDNGFIGVLGEWVLRTACRQLKCWQVEGFDVPKVAVNLSARQFEQGGIVQLVSDVLAETGLSPACLELEITESVIMDNDAAFEKIDALRALGVLLSVDDFGTGYSSLSYLNRLPIQQLKIDRSFVVALADDVQNGAIVRAIIALGKSLGVSVIAEGVEDEGQAFFLRREGCDHGQGFLYGKPLPVIEFERAWCGGDLRGDNRLPVQAALR